MSAIPQAPQRPVILVAARQREHGDQVGEQLRKRYEIDYDIRVVASSADAATVIDTLRQSGGAMALLLADDPTPLASGFSVFAHARRHFPDVRRGLLIEWGAWSDPEASRVVLGLMAMGQIDYYVIRPWRSPDEYFHRTVTEFLMEWERAIDRTPREVTIIAEPTSARAHELRSMLARSGVPHAYRSTGSDEAVALLEALGEEPADVPLLVLHDGRVLRDPTNADVTRAYGMPTDLPDTDEVDVVVVGAGPAGLAAAVYGASEGLSTVVVERDAIGGQAGSSSLIRNYLGFSRGIGGAELTQRAYQQAWVFGTSFALTREAVGLRRDDGGLVVTVSPGQEIRTRSVVLATGVSYRRLGIPELEALAGAGVFYGASNFEAKALEGRVAHVVGGGNSAGQAALHLARYAASVTLLVRGETLAESMSAYLIEQLESAGVAVQLYAGVVGGGGEHGLDHIVIRDLARGTDATVATDGLFILIGALPLTSWLPPEVMRDRWGYVITGEEVAAEGGTWSLSRPPQPLETSMPGVFAAGDVRRRSAKRVASAVGEGSVVISQVHTHLAEIDAPARQ
ncbi:MAG: FAD-dependent oxidoreductase [Acidimicrobiia bacterium]